MASQSHDSTFNFDFDFAMPQQSFDGGLKTSGQGNTASGYFDEGIDTTGSNGSLFGQQSFEPMMDPSMITGFGMEQPLTLDDTSVGAWANAATMAPFPSTPAQSFENMYNAHINTSPLGKRPLQLDVQDFPLPKRHETLGYSPFTGTASVTGSSWAVDTQLTPSSSGELGLSDEAADVCATWFSKYNVLPSDRHIDSLSQLTGESATAIRNWFGQALKQGMTHDSAYKSQTGFAHQDPLLYTGSSGPSDTTQLLLPELPCVHDAQTTTTTTAATTIQGPLRGGRKGCNPTDDPELLKRDSNKIYQCTRKCGKRYGRKCDWKRNEEEGYPSKSWICALCISQGDARVKPCFRKYHFSQHFRNIHPGLNSADYEQASIVESATDFPKRCGFCPHRFTDRQDRIDHIAEHFKSGKSMLDWADEDDESNGDSDNTDDNDDDSDRPDSGDFGGSEPFLPPRQDPRGGSSNSKRNSNGGSGSGGSGGQQSHCGHLQFQLAQSPESADTSADLHTRPEHKLCSSDQRDLQERVGTTEESHTLSLAGDAVTVALNKLRSQDTSSQHVADATSGELTSYYAQHSVTEEANIGDCEATADVVSSIKANIGHSEAAAGAASLIKAVLAITPTKSPVIQPYTSVKRQRGSFINHHHSGTSRKGWNSFTVEKEANEKGLCSLPDCRHVSKDLEAHMLTHQIEQIPSTLVPDPPIDVDLRSESQAAHSSPQMNEPLRRSMSPFNSQSFLSVKLLGQGGFSTVDEVVHRETSLRVSRKTLKNRNRSALDELKKEVDVLQKLRHPHIVRLLGAYSNGDKMSILLAPVADTTLSAWLEAPVLREPAALAQTIVKMLGCLASSVRYLHEQRPVVKHMDIKPQNILIIQGDQEFPHVVLSDFGISSVQSEAEHGKPAPLTRQYCAPEVSEGISREQAADIWSLGCVFAEMATVAFKDGNSSWLDFRRHFRGRDSKYYWQDVPALHSWLSKFLEASCDSTETTVVRTVKSMLDPEPMHRPDATELTLTFTPAPCCLSWPNDNSSYPGPVEESASVEMFVREDSVDGHAHSHQHGTDDDQEPCDPVSHAKSWIDECAQSHHACHQHSTGPKTLPTRLVDIRPNNATDGTVRIVDSASLEDTSSSIDYISLGYLWDQHEPVLSTDRLQAMRNELGRDSLPRALNEAIAAADRMGYRYLWVDSLCVLQDSEEDKERECLATADVYRNSTLTIVLDQLQNSFSDPTTTQEVSSRRTDGIYDPCSTSPTTALSAVDFSTPGFGWDTRAWALQERFLSPRHLHLGEQQMYWECNALKASETFPRGLPPLLWEKVHTKPSSNILPKALQYNVDNKLPARAELDVIAKATRRTTPPLSARSTCGDGPIDNVDTCSSNEHQ